MLFEIDSWILEKHERFSHFTQRNFGLDCFWLAKVFAFLSSVSLYQIGFLAIFFIFFSTLGWIVLIAQTERFVKEYCHPRGLCNDTKSGFIYRIFFAVFVGVLSQIMPGESLGDVLWALNLVAMQYFRSCDPLPPGSSKVRVWLESLWAKAKEKFSREPEPATQPA